MTLEADMVTSEWAGCSRGPTPNPKAARPATPTLWGALLKESQPPDYDTYISVLTHGVSCPLSREDGPTSSGDFVPPHKVVPVQSGVYPKGAGHCVATRAHFSELTDHPVNSPVLGDVLCLWF